VEGGDDQTMCCDALPQTTGGLQRGAGVLMMVLVFLGGCIATVANAGYMYLRNLKDGLDQKIDAKVDALGQKIDAQGANITEQKGDAKMQEMDLLRTQIHDLGQTMEQNTKALITQMDGLLPERNTAAAPESRLEIEVADPVGFEGRLPGAKGLENPSFPPSASHPAAEDVQQTDAAVGPRFPFSCAPCENAAVVASAVPISPPAPSTR